MNAEQPSDRIAELAARFWDFQCHEFPMRAILAGVETPDATLFRESADDYARRRSAASGMLQELDGIADGALPVTERATSRLLRDELQEIVESYDLLEHCRPSMYPFGPEFSTMNFANMTRVENAASAARYAERLAAIPSFVRDMQANLLAGHGAGLRYPQIVLQRAVANLRNALAAPVDELPWFGPFKRTTEAQASAVHEQRERTQRLIRDEIVPSLTRHADFLERTLADGARTTISCSDTLLGPEFYRALVRRFTTTDLAPDEVYELGLTEVARVSGEIDAVAAQAGYAGDTKAYGAFLTGDPRFIAVSKDALREQTERLCKRIDKCIPGFFGHLPRITYGIETIPEHLAGGLPPAYAQVNPVDRTMPGIYWVTSLPERCPSYLHVPLALHEAWPGHLMHIALVQEMDDLPAFRRNGAMKHTACVEGWALYCESLGVDMGLYETTDQHYGRLQGEMWRALRLVVDTGIHWKRWSREQAVNYMGHHSSLPRATVETEIDRYIALPGQALAYQIGSRTFRSLRRRAQETLGSRFSLRTFHDALMAAGPVTMPVLADVIEDWLSRQQREQVGGPA